jgi:hypothetical protein
MAAICKVRFSSPLANVITVLPYSGIIVCIVFTFFISNLNKKNINSIERLTNLSDGKLETLTFKSIDLNNKLNFAPLNIPETIFAKPKIIYIRTAVDTVYRTLYIDNTEYKAINLLRQKQSSDSIKLLLLRDSYIFCSESQIPSLKRMIDSLRLQVDSLRIQSDKAKSRRVLFGIFRKQP